ncbi:tetratricopeptide repeat protein [Sorangium sp. So ce118]
MRDAAAPATALLSVLLSGCGASSAPSAKVEARQVAATPRAAPSAAPAEPVRAPGTELFPPPPAEDPAADLSRCERGDMEGCRAAGWLFLHGSGVVEDAARAEELYTKACHGNNTKACMEFAVEYRHPHDWPDRVRPELAEATFHELACERGDRDGCLALALDVIRHPEELPAHRDDVKTAQKTAENACAASHVAACSTLLEVAERKEDERRRQALAEKLLAMCRAGEVRACERALFHSWANKTPDERNSIRKETGIPWCKFSQAECRAGRAERCPFAITCVGPYSYDPQGPAAAAELTYHACVDGRDFTRCATLAGRFERGDGVPADPEKARVFDLAACQHGNHDGCSRTVSRLEKEGRGPEIDKKIFEAAKMGCRIDERDSGWPSICDRLARMYETGTGTQKDVEKAVGIFTARCQTRGVSCKELRRLNRPLPQEPAGAEEP